MLIGQTVLLLASFLFFKDLLLYKTLEAFNLIRSPANMMTTVTTENYTLMFA